MRHDTGLAGKHLSGPRSLIALVCLACALIARWPGVARADCSGTWQVVPTASIVSISGGSSLTDVSGSSPDDVWAVGARSETTGHTTLTEHWDGNAWTFVPSPRASALDNGLNGVDAISPADAWAVGYQRRLTGEYRTLALHWDASAWSIVRTHHPGRSHSTPSTGTARHGPE